MAPIHLKPFSFQFLSQRFLKHFTAALLFGSVCILAQNETCMENCHADQNLTRERDGKKSSMFVDLDKYENSVHGSSDCTDCHGDAEDMDGDHHSSELESVDCSACHDDIMELYGNSIHAQSGKDKTTNASCSDCHDIHNVMEKTNHESPTFTLNIPMLCARCHTEGKKATVGYEGKTHKIIQNYSMSIHGKGLLESGLVVTATCISCHSAHSIQPASNPESTVHRDKIAKTCAACHVGILEKFNKSVHSPEVTKTDLKLPRCNDCHTPHTVNRAEQERSQNVIMEHCGTCHEELAEHYFETFHGKVSKLGFKEAAKCYDCHGNHNILPASNPDSTISEGNKVHTCAKCHEQANQNFAKYLTHANEQDREKYPSLFYSFWFMTLLLLGTFGFFGIHTLLWLYRGLKERDKIPTRAEKRKTYTEKHVQRFDVYSRSLHLMIIVSFISLAITGMTLKFSHVPLFQGLSLLMGGFKVTGVIHRMAAIITFLYFILHIGYLVNKRQKRKLEWKDLLIGERTLVPRFQDAVEFWQTLKWFLGKGPKPAYGRWTYWEKFDYFAVFWGVSIIGFTGLILWFPEFFTSLGIPGNVINISTIIHSDEALLATGFIFTIHFFNTHFRPEKFPIDPVIFTGCMSMEEFREERPREYELALQENRLEELLVDPPTKKFRRSVKTFGMICLSIGIFTVLLIIYSLLQ